MADVLTQAEIDALINGISSGDPSVTESKDDDNPQNVRNYDFRTANRFSKEQIRTINVIYENFARLFASYLSTVLRSSCNAGTVTVEELKYSEFVNSLQPPVVLAILRMPPLTGPHLVAMNDVLDYAIISRLLGGEPSATVKSDQFTEIELVLIERIIRQTLPILSESWEKVVGTQPALDRVETSPQFAQIVANSETIMLITIELFIDDIRGTFSVCLPQVALEPINAQLTTQYLYQTGEGRVIETAKEDINKRISRTLLPVRACFKETLTSVYDVLNLARGDVLRLDHHVNDKLILKVGHIPKFYGDIGTKDNRYAIKISEIIQREDADDE